MCTGFVLCLIEASTDLAPGSIGLWSHSGCCKGDLTAQGFPETPKMGAMSLYKHGVCVCVVDDAKFSHLVTSG